ncbi:MAG: C_GCAxxG_C_C family protein [Alistipes sp.]|jgi:C_GCAxxG_C_C family probable redox protein|nr:C_GCAxxG_C_C family protein [Alistipes sp.]
MKVNPQERAEQAREYFTSGYNCAQSVFLAYQDITGIDEVLAATISAPFGGGMGRLREVCGAVSGMTMVAGFIAPNSQPNDNENKKNCYATVQALAEEFRAENGSIVCRELLGLAQQKDDPTPSPRTGEYYKRRPCAEYVAIAARIVGEKINAME